jgi:hypothetical protein
MKIMTKQPSILSKTFGALFKSFWVFAVVLSVFGLFDAILFQGLIQYLGLDTSQEFITAGGINIQQAELLKLILGMQGITLVGRIILLGPIFNSIAVYSGKAYMAKKATSLYGAVNFALSRYKRLFVPNLLAQLSIQIGMLIIIPGVMSWMQFAFVDSVACLEEEKHVLTRSKRLTKGRRKSIFLVILPWIFFSQVFGILELYASTINFGAVVITSILMECLLMLMMLAFFMLYDKRIQLLEEKIAARSKQKQKEAEKNE